MDRKTQDRNWNNLTEEKKNEYRDLYQKGLDYVRNENGYLQGLGQGELNVIVDVFGEDNLLTKSTPKTWEDFLKKFHKETDWNPKNEFADLILYGMNDKIKSKILATAKIAKLIELSYGGMVSEEEWINDRIYKYCVERNRNKLDYMYCTTNYHFVAFHTPEQREEFMSYESNRKLVEQYLWL